MRILPLLFLAVSATFVIADEPWPIHSLDRPKPPASTPKPEAELKDAAKAPATATVLFDGKDLSQWVKLDGSAPQWKIVDGTLEVVPDSGNMKTKDGFGSGKLHVEWKVPVKRKGDGQDGSNSGIFLMSDYEIQVLDAYENVTYADGYPGAVYGQNPPSSNPSRPPGEWNYYDITWHRPQFDKDGKLTKPAFVTVVFNGVTVQDNFQLTGPTAHKAQPPYKAHADKVPLMLQDHGHPVEYRNIWFDPIAD
jgi:hypothetical protein